MAHEIMNNTATGKAEMAYVGKTPWHGLGQQLTENAPIEVWQKEAGFDWDILSASLCFKTPKQTKENGARRRTIHKVPNREVLYRSDNLLPLSVVSNRYKEVQPKEVLEFFRDLVSTGGYKLNTAGILFGGQKFWALAEIGKSAKIAGVDEIGGYLLLATSCDGSLATTAALTSIRVVCNNTLGMSIYDVETGKSKHHLKVPHSRVFDADQVKKEMGLIQGSFDIFAEKANQMAKRRISDREASEWLIKLFVKHNADQEAVKELLNGSFDQKQEEREVVAELLGQTVSREERTEAVELLLENVNTRSVKQVYELYKGAAKGSNLKSADGTAWGLLNAVTEWGDFHRNCRTDDSRLNNAWFGSTSTIKNTALKMAEELI